MKTVAVYSIKGGVGKTAFAVNFAYRASVDYGRVLLVDLDPQAAASFYLRVKPAAATGPRELLGSGDRLEDCIRGSDFERLDVLPAAESFRMLDVAFSSRKKPKRRLEKLFAALGGEYDLIVLDTPPNLTLLAENVFRAADLLVVPVIPTPLSERTFVQLRDFLARTLKGRPPPVRGFFSMVEGRKTIHRDAMARLRSANPDMMDATIPYSATVERMGVSRRPLPLGGRAGTAAAAYGELCRELLDELTFTVDRPPDESGP